MSKVMKTKKAILALLASRRKTLTDISRELGLAPSTIGQHLKELKDSGVIHLVDNPYTRKWKYYEKNVPNAPSMGLNAAY